MRLPATFVAVFALALSACGWTVGDACTVGTDCGKALCLNRGNTPGGYCSVGCTGNQDCPHGSTCVVEGTATSGNCYLSCSRDSDCRAGYKCLVSPGPGGANVCIGQNGF